MPAPNDPELDAMLGAYALDALDADERTRVEAYVERNARARDEVDELRESAASLALAPVDDTSAPPGLWDRIASAIEADVVAPDDSQDAAGRDELATRRARRGRGPRWMSWAVAAAAVAAVVLAAQVISLHRRLDDARGTGEKDAAAAFVRAGHVDGARQVALVPAHGAEVARVVLLPDGSGYLKSDGLAPLDAAHTYQLWALTGTAGRTVAISAGVLGADPSAAAFRTSPDVHGLAITVERAPGVAQPSRAPYASATLT
ncbi:MAG TPA: anti-sigma factor [Acidimicrobiia bacterium]